jgi:hypothetical protein
MKARWPKQSWIVTLSVGAILALSAGRSLGVVSLTESLDSFPLVAGGMAAPIVLPADAPEVVRIAARDLAADVARVTGVTPEVVANQAAAGSGPRIELSLAPADLAGRWEAFRLSANTNVLTIAGSDRRGLAFGIYELSRRIGVSPWYWWADVPVSRRSEVRLSTGAEPIEQPQVKYRGIFINDEDWGLHQWAKQTFEPEFGGIGPKTYEKVFELMLRLRLNYLWPAMHEVSREFHTVPANIELAHRYAIVAGSSHCEPMLFNNCKWNTDQRGSWDYTTNRANILAAWEEQVKTRGDKEAVWGLGIRGIHDAGMRGPKDTRARIKILVEVFTDQRCLIDQHVTKQWGPVAQAFVPYKEVLPLYDAGLSVPEDVTIVWVDDNFGYIRRLGRPAERARAGGAGVYWHLSYYGGPHSYLWINATAPALMWQELHKAWENDARTLWVVNVGDIKPAEIGVDYFAQLAWRPESFGPDSQPRFLREFAARTFGAAQAEATADFLMEFYRLGTVRRPELMIRSWALGLTDAEADRLRQDYEQLLQRESALGATVSAAARDAWYQTIGFPARVLGASGLIFMADRALQLGGDAAAATNAIAQHRGYLEQQVQQYNQSANGKWKHMMPGLVTVKNLMAWNSQVRWPWGEKPDTTNAAALVKAPERAWRDAAAADRQSAANAARWVTVAGLGRSARAVALKPAGLSSSWKETDPAAPTLEFDFESGAGAGQEVCLEFLPTFRIYPGLKLRVAVRIDDQPPVLVEVPGSSGKEDENGSIRAEGVQNNVVRACVPLPGLTASKHVLKVSAVDPGAVLDRVSLPTQP